MLSHGERWAISQFLLKSALLWWMMIGCSACTLRTLPALPPSPPPSPTAPEATAAVTAPFPTPSLFYTWTDENATLAGICFESALDAAGRTFVLRSEAELRQFYDLADNSRLCLRPVARNMFDFTDGRVLAGVWSAGSGCTARHDLLDVQQDDAAQTLTVTLRFITEGDCPYELVRPYWVGIAGAGAYTIRFDVVR